MIEKIKQHFQALWDDEPGERFQKQFRRRQKNRNHPLLDKFVFVGGGVLVMAAGIIDLPFPGPGTLIIITGLGLIAQESMWLSKLLDWLEIEVRKYMALFDDWWEGAWVVQKAVVVLFTVIIFAFAGWIIYWLSTALLSF